MCAAFTPLLPCTFYATMNRSILSWDRSKASDHFVVVWYEYNTRDCRLLNPHKLTFLKKKISVGTCLFGRLDGMVSESKIKSTGRTLIYFRLFHILQFKGKIKEILFSLMLDADDGSKSFHQIGGLFMCLASLQLTLNLNTFEQVRAGLI